MDEKASEQKEVKEIKINMPANLVGGVYSNLMTVSHTREEFIMDFAMLHGSVGVVTARVIMSPGHMKRTVSALQDNLKKYEEVIGKIQEAPQPKGKLGFQPPST
jgi:hypothetical protein